MATVSRNKLPRGVKLTIDHIYTPLVNIQNQLQGEIEAENIKADQVPFRLNFNIPMMRCIAAASSDTELYKYKGGMMIPFVLPPLQDDFSIDQVLTKTTPVPVLDSFSFGFDQRGEACSIIGPDPNMFGGPIKVSLTEGGEWKEYSSSDMLIGKTNIFNKSLRSNEEPEVANYRGVGLSEMIDAIENKRTNRCNGKLSLHVLDMIDSTINAAINGVEQNLRTNCERPMVFSENEIKQLMK